METQRRESKSFDAYTPVTATPSRLRQLGADASSFAKIAAAVSIVAMGIVFLLSYRDLPARTEKNHQDIVSVRASMDSLRSDIRELKTTSAQQLCLTIAEKQHTDWRACFIQAGPISVLSVPRAP